MSILSDLILMAESHDTERTKDLATDTLLGCIQEDDKKPDFKTVLKLVKTKGIERQTGLSCNEIKDAARSLIDGRAIEDIKELVVVAAKILPDLERTLPQSINLLLHRLTTFPGILHDRLDDLKNNRSGITFNTIHDLVQRLERLDNDPSVELTRATLVALLENDTLVTALVVYANLHQVPIEKQDVSFVRKQLQEPGIDIPELVEQGKTRLLEKYQITKAQEIITKLQNSQNLIKNSKQFL